MIKEKQDSGIVKMPGWQAREMLFIDDKNKLEIYPVLKQAQEEILKMWKKAGYIQEDTE